MHVGVTHCKIGFTFTRITTRRECRHRWAVVFKHSEFLTVQVFSRITNIIAYFQSLKLSKYSQHQFLSNMQPRERLLADTFDTTTGHFGQYGGQYAPESQMGFLESLTKEFETALLDVNFWDDFCSLLTQRPSPLNFAPGLTRQGGGAKIWSWDIWTVTIR